MPAPVLPVRTRAPCAASHAPALAGAATELPSRDTSLERVRVLLFVAVLLLLAGGGVWASADADRAARQPAAETPQAKRMPAPRPRRRASPLPVAVCPDGVADCRSVSGRVLFVESVDPDGDGDLHAVLTGRDGVSAAGITAVDVKPALRPKRDPRIGDRVSAAGPVQTGSFGQAQVHALDLHLRRR